MRDSSVKSFVFLSLRQTGSENEGLWALWWAHCGDPVSDPEELFTEPKTQYNKTQRRGAKARELTDCPSWSSGWGEYFLGGNYCPCLSVHNTRSTSVTLLMLMIYLIINIKLYIAAWTDTADICIGHILPAFPGIKRTQLSGLSVPPPLPQTPANHLPFGTVQT